MVQCAACGKFMNAKDGVSCPQCSSNSHYECVRIPAGAVVNSSWRCGDCQAKTPKGRDPITPIRGLKDSYLDQDKLTNSKAGKPMLLDDTAHDITIDSGEMERQLDLKSLKDEMKSSFNKFEQLFLSEFKSMREEVVSMRSDIRNLKQDIVEVKVSVNRCTERADSLDLRVQANSDEIDRLEERLITLQQTGAGATGRPLEVSSLERTISELKAQLNERDQDALTNDVELSGVPEIKGENSSQLVSVLTMKLGINMDEREIVSIERAGAPRRSQDVSQMTARPRRIIIRFSRRVIRDEFLHAARVRRGLTSADLGVEGPPARIFVNERLTQSNKLLFMKVREVCRQHQWRYSWTKGGRIFIRKEHGTPSLRIRSESDLDRCFGKPSV